MILFSFLSLLFANDFKNTIEKHGDSSINWTQMRLEGTAYVEQNGPTDDYAKQEARALALAHQALKETFDHFQLNPKTTLDDISSEDSKTQRYILANAKKYKVSQTSYQETGGVAVNVYWDIHTLLRPVIIEHSSEKVSTAPPKTHTGIIIDVRGLNFAPILFPEIMKTDGSPWLNVAGFSKDKAEVKLPFIYAPYAAHSTVIERGGDNPAIFTAKSISGHQIIINNSSSTELSDTDAKSIMANGNIVILLDL